VAASGDESAELLPLVSRAQGVLVMAGQVGNGHAVESAYRLVDLTKAPVALVLDAPGSPIPFSTREPDEAMA
jgi:hypothetical protein